MLRPCLLLACLALAACDTDRPDPLVFGGVEVMPDGDATLSVDAGVLVVSGLSGSRSGGFAVAGDPQRFDVETDPVTIPAGGRFGILVEDTAGQPVAELSHEAVTGSGSDQARLRFAFPDDVLAARVTYKRDGRVVFVIPTLDLTPSDGRLAQQGSAGEAQGKASSVHVIRNSKGQYIVVSDSEEATQRGGPTACLGFTITPPVALPPAEFPDGRLCADWVEIEPQGGPTSGAARVAVTGRGLGTFRVRTLGAAY